MKDNAIKKILIEDLENMSSENFNERIIQKLDLDKKKERKVLFREHEIVMVFITVFLLILGVYFEMLSLDLTTILILSAVSITPLFFIVYNKIYQSINQQL